MLGVVVMVIVIAVGLIGMFVVTADISMFVFVFKVFFWLVIGVLFIAPMLLVLMVMLFDLLQYNNLIFYGGAVEHCLKVYIIWWGL